MVGVHPPYSGSSGIRNIGTIKEEFGDKKFFCNGCILLLRLSQRNCLGDMGRIFVVTLEGDIYSCKHCKTHLALVDDIVSKSFHCRHGNAYLFNKVENVTVGEIEARMMITGMHTVVDIFCVTCGSIVGWKYEFAFEMTQKYKEGKFILERFKVLGPDGSSYPGIQDAEPAGSDADE